LPDITAIRRPGAGRHARAEVAEARRCDDPTVGRQVATGQEPSVAAVEDAVADEQRPAGASFRVLDNAERLHRRLAIDGSRPGAGRVKVVSVPAREAPA
jgi:hypothetical protein